MNQTIFQSSTTRKAAADIFLIVQTMMWGVSFILMKNIIAAMSPMAFLAIRFGLGALFLLPFYIRRLRGAMSAGFVRASLVLGGLLFLSMGLQVFGLRYTSVTNSSFITSTTVLLVPVFERLIFKKKLPRALWAGCMVAFAGIAVLAGSVSLSLNVGDMLTMLCAAGFSLQILFAARYAARFSADMLGFAQISLAALFFTVLWGIDGFPISGFQPAFIGSILFMAIVNTSIGFVGQVVALKYTQPVVASLIFSLEPIFATMFAMIIPNINGDCETLTLKTSMGALLVLAGVAVALWDSFRIKRPARTCEEPAG